MLYGRNLYNGKQALAKAALRILTIYYETLNYSLEDVHRLC